MNELLSTAQAAKALNISERTIRRMIDRESLHAYRANDPKAKKPVYRVARSEVEALHRAMLRLLVELTGDPAPG